MNEQHHIIKVATYSLVAIITAMIGMFIYAVIDPTVDDDKVFQIIGPSFQTVVGAFVGLVAGLKIGEDDR
jgi:uncharacterized membrane protein YraQ (UPF0718 family)